MQQEPQFIIDIELGDRHVEIDHARVPVVDASGRYLWIVRTTAGKSERLIVDVALETVTPVRDTTGGCPIFDGVWSAGHFVGWTWPENKDGDGPGPVNICVVDQQARVVHATEPLELCWGAAASYYALSVIELSADASSLVVFHGGCGGKENLGFMLRLGDGVIRRITETRPNLPTLEQAEQLHDVLYHQDEPFELELSDTTFEQPNAIARGLGNEYELVFGTTQNYLGGRYRPSN